MVVNEAPVAACVRSRSYLLSRLMRSRARRERKPVSSAVAGRVEDAIERPRHSGTHSTSTANWARPGRGPQRGPTRSDDPCLRTHGHFRTLLHHRLVSSSEERAGERVAARLLDGPARGAPPAFSRAPFGRSSP